MILPSASLEVVIPVAPMNCIVSPLSTKRSVLSSAATLKLYSSDSVPAGMSARVINPTSFASSLSVVGCAAVIVILPSASLVVVILAPPSILICSPLSTTRAVESSAPILKLYSSESVLLGGRSASVI